jgi:hypothetical protein
MARKLNDGKITVIAAVTRPAQKGATAILLKRDDSDPFDDAAFEKLTKRTFTAAERKESEEKGHAMAGGRYPIENTSDLENAIQSVGRGKGSHGAIRAHIMTQARRLGATDKIPDDWKATKNDVSLLRNAIRAADFDFRFDDLSKFAHRIAKDCVEVSPEKAELFDDVHASTEAQEYSCAMMEEFNECYSDLCRSVSSIFSDETGADKAKMLETTFQQFKDAIQGVVPEGLEKAISSALTQNSDGGVMTKAIAKALNLPETATEADIVAALGKQATDIATLKAAAEMSGKHKAFMENDDAKMPTGGKSAFAAMSPADRDAHMKSNPIKEKEKDDVDKMIAKGEAFKDADTGTVLTKADFGSEAGFVFAKSQAAKSAKLTADLQKSEDARSEAAFAKSAEAYSMVGAPADVGKLLHGINKADPKLAEGVVAILKTAQERIAKGGLFTEIGNGGGANAGGSALDQLNKLADTLKKTDTTGKLTQAQAFAKAYEDPANRELVQRYKEESRKAA